MPCVKHSVQIMQPPSIVYSFLSEPNRIREWAPLVSASKYTSGTQQSVGDSSNKTALSGNTIFEIEADLKPVGGGKFNFKNLVQESIRDKKIVWKQIEGPMKELEWIFDIEPVGHAGNSTRLGLTLQYKMPYSFLGYLMDKVKMNRVLALACQVNLDGLKKKLEQQHTSTALSADSLKTSAWIGE